MTAEQELELMRRGVGHRLMRVLLLHEIISCLHSVTLYYHPLKTSKPKTNKVVFEMWPTTPKSNIAAEQSALMTKCKCRSVLKASHIWEK